MEDLVVALPLLVAVGCCVGIPLIGFLLIGSRSRSKEESLPRERPDPSSTSRKGGV